MNSSSSLSKENSKELIIGYCESCFPAAPTGPRNLGFHVVLNILQQIADLHYGPLKFKAASIENGYGFSNLDGDSVYQQLNSGSIDVMDTFVPMTIASQSLYSLTYPLAFDRISLYVSRDLEASLANRTISADGLRLLFVHGPLRSDTWAVVAGLLVLLSIHDLVRFLFENHFRLKREPILPDSSRQVILNQPRVNTTMLVVQCIKTWISFALMVSVGVLSLWYSSHFKATTVLNLEHPSLKFEKIISLIQQNRLVPVSYMPLERSPILVEWNDTEAVDDLSLLQKTLSNKKQLLVNSLPEMCRFVAEAEKQKTTNYFFMESQSRVESFCASHMSELRQISFSGRALMLEAIAVSPRKPDLLQRLNNFAYSGSIRAVFRTLNTRVCTLMQHSTFFRRCQNIHRQPPGNIGLGHIREALQLYVLLILGTIMVLITEVLIARIMTSGFWRP